MKKMNLSFLGLKAKMVLPLFLLIGLFLVSANTSNAQSIVVKRNTTTQLLSSEKGFYESVSKHVSELPVSVSMVLPIMKSSKEAINNHRALSVSNLFQISKPSIFEINILPPSRHSLNIVFSHFNQISNF